MIPKNRPPTHPGEMLLEEYFEIRLVSARRNLRFTLVGPMHGSMRSLTAREAFRLILRWHSVEALKTGADFWLNLQRNWDLWHSMQTHKKIAPHKKAG